MTDNLTVIIAAGALAFLAVRLYQKYAGKNRKAGNDKGKKEGAFTTRSGDDDYEPYSKK